VEKSVKPTIQMSLVIVLLILFFHLNVSDSYILTSINISQIHPHTNNTRSNIVELENDYIQKIQANYIEDNFKNESKIYLMDNLFIDKKVGEVNLLKINLTLGGWSSDQILSFQQTNDGGYIFVGYTESYTTNESDVWLIKIDKFGKIQWQKIFGGPHNETGYSIELTIDGGYIIIGKTDSYGAGNYDVWLIKTNNKGEMEWNKTFGGVKSDSGYHILRTIDEGYIILGYTLSFGDAGWNAWLIKTNINGSMKWNRTYGEKNANKYCKSIQETEDGGYIIIGHDENYEYVPYLKRYSYDSDIWLLKVDSLGIEQWNKTFGGNNSEDGYSIQQTSDNGYILVGMTKSYGFGGLDIMGRPCSDIWVIKTNNMGIMEWNKTYGGNMSEEGLSIQHTIDGGFIIAGMKEFNKYDPIYGISSNNQDIWLIKIDNEGSIIWNKTYEIGTGIDDFCNTIKQTSDKGYIIIGTILSPYYGSFDVWIFRIDDLGNTNPNGILYSVNLLKGENAYSINLFNYSSSILINTSIKVQFSQNSLTWYNSTGALNGWDILLNGSNSIDLSSLKWNGTQFYYKINFTSENLNLPCLTYINMSYLQKIDPGKLDTDGDGLLDGDSNNSQSWMDIDDDDDSIPDKWEIQYGLNPLNPGDADLDKDEDGFTNREEYDADTDPSDPDDHPNENNPIIDEDKDKKNPGKDYTIYVILIVIIIVILIILSIIMGLKKKKR
jgi:hypothetical protein